MVLRVKKIKIDGEEIEVEEFDSKVVPGSGNEETSIKNLFEEEEIENALNRAIRAIELIFRKEKKGGLNYFYEVGKILGFVDKNGWQDIRGRIWERMAGNLRPDLFLGEKQIKTEKKRIPEFMYLIAKVPKRYLYTANLEQWHEILKFKNIYREEKLLEKILNFVRETNPSGSTVRKGIKKLRSRKNQRPPTPRVERL